MSGRVVHFEIPADNLDRAQDFYRAAFGWTLNAMPGMGYALVTTTPTDETGTPTAPGAINGGMLARQEPVTSTVITVEVADIDQSLEAVVTRGGTVVRSGEPVSDMGIAAYVRDSEGNLLGLWQSLR